MTHRDPLTTLEHLKVKPLSDAERGVVWMRIKDRLAATLGHDPMGVAHIESPFPFFSRKVLAYAFAFIVVLGTVGASNGAAPGGFLFPVDLAIERVESAFDASSRADHARERLSEFDRALGIKRTKNGETRVATQERVVSESAEMMALSVADDAAQEGIPWRELPPEIQEAIDATRRELYKIEAEATLKGDAETLAEIQLIISEFESRVRSL